VSLVDPLKLLGGPGSLRLLAIGCLAGIAVLYLWPRYRTMARAWLIALAGVYLALALPLVAHSIAAPLDAAAATLSAPRDQPLDLLVIFAGDNADARIAQAARSWRELQPRSVLVSGEQWFVDELIEAGLPPGRMAIDSKSMTTREQVDYLDGYLRGKPARAAAVVVSRLQAPRTAALLHVRRLPVAIVAAAVDEEPDLSGWRRLLPSFAALRVSRDALYERVALSYYRYRGWIAPAIN
jgi:uncharacterized SAM-binding protein YcdF (DUF218 family)